MTPEGVLNSVEIRHPSHAEVATIVLFANGILFWILSPAKKKGLRGKEAFVKKWKEREEGERERE